MFLVLAWEADPWPHPERPIWGITFTGPWAEWHAFAQMRTWSAEVFVRAHLRPSFVDPAAPSPAVGFGPWTPAKLGP